MKKFILLLMVGLFFSQLTQAQLFKGEIIGGFNFSQVDGDEVYGFNRIGINAGAGVEISLNEKWSLSLENVFSQKGAFQKKQFEDSITGEYDLRLNYVEVPLLLHYNEKNILQIGAGMSWGRLVKEKEIEQGGNVVPYNDSVSFSKNDISILADIRFRIYKSLKINLRYSYSIKKIRQRVFADFDNNSWERDQFNNVLSLRLIYVINERSEGRRRSVNE